MACGGANIKALIYLADNGVSRQIGNVGVYLGEMVTGLEADFVKMVVIEE